MTEANLDRPAYTMRDAAQAFADAIEQGRLSETETPDADHVARWPYTPHAPYAGRYMYMLTDANGVDMFKGIVDRLYLPPFPVGARVVLADGDRTGAVTAADHVRLIVRPDDGTIDHQLHSATASAYMRRATEQEADAGAEAAGPCMCPTYENHAGACGGPGCQCHGGGPAVV